MKKEFTLSERIGDVCRDGIHKEDAKEKIQTAQKRLKEVGKERLKHLPSENYELFCEDIDKIFLEEFGKKLT